MTIEEGHWGKKCVPYDPLSRPEQLWPGRPARTHCGADALEAMDDVIRSTFWEKAGSGEGAKVVRKGAGEAQGNEFKQSEEVDLKLWKFK